MALPGSPGSLARSLSLALALKPLTLRAETFLFSSSRLQHVSPSVTAWYPDGSQQKFSQLSSQPHDAVDRSFSKNRSDGSRGRDTRSRMTTAERWRIHTQLISCCGCEMQDEEGGLEHEW